MAATFTWTIANVEATNTADKVVTVSHWRCTGVDGDNTAAAYGTCSHEGDPADAGFIAYDNLTEADVLGWVWASLDKDATEAAIQGQLDAQANPPTVSGTPWA